MAFHNRKKVNHLVVKMWLDFLNPVTLGFSGVLQNLSQELSTEAVDITLMPTHSLCCVCSLGNLYMLQIAQ